ncbi:MAG TPA: hypothetical protein PLM63_02885 [bacterium]|nr:hypothetical protein [bacterium]
MTDIEEYGKSFFKWNFSEDDWLIDIIFKNRNIRHQLFIVKNYNMNILNEIIFELLNTIQKYRTELELNCQAFTDKKKYLNLFKNNNKIQITLEEEYLLKELIEQYKLYEAIGWFHIGKNTKIVKYSVLKKKEILEKIYPIVNLSIRKVIGAKVISPYKIEFEEAVNNAWTAIIKYLPKIDTSRVMFSIFIGIAHRSAIYYNATGLKNKYISVNSTDLNFLNNDVNDLTEEEFFNTVLNNQNLDDIEDEILTIIEAENIDENKIQYCDNSYIGEIDEDIKEILDDIGESSSILQYIQESILAYSYTVLSGKIKKICLEKIYAEFFNDLINSKIPEKVILKHTPVIIEIMNAASINLDNADTEENNSKLYKLLKDWIKEKIAIKLKQIHASPESINARVLEITARENNMIHYLKDHKHELLKKFVEFKNVAVKLT